MPKKKNETKQNNLKKPIPEDFKLSDDEPKTVNLNKEQKLTSKFITFDCPICCCKLYTVKKRNRDKPERYFL